MMTVEITITAIGVLVQSVMALCNGDMLHEYAMGMLC